MTLQMPTSSIIRPHGVIREGTVDDIPQMVDIHSRVFPDTLMANLGRDYLETYYQNVLTFSGGIVIVAQLDGNIAGFASGLVNPERFYRSVVRNSWKTAGYIVKGIFRNPGLLSVIPYSIGRVFRSTPRTSSQNTCELSFIAMRPETAGKGIGKELASEFLKRSREKGAEVVRLTTHAEHNDATNNFYAALGFKVTRTFRQCHGCLTNEYVYPTSVPHGSESSLCD